jgi:activator of 2-hydroxyglutaryl-CoA dehydratase
MALPSERLILGIDVGSTTVKMVAVDAGSRQILWSDYQRHETRQPGKTPALLTAAAAALPGIAASETQIVLIDQWQRSGLDQLRHIVAGMAANQLYEL